MRPSGLCTKSDNNKRMITLTVITLTNAYVLYFVSLLCISLQLTTCIEQINENGIIKMKKFISIKVD